MTYSQVQRSLVLTFMLVKDHDNHAGSKEALVEDALHRLVIDKSPIKGVI